MPPSRGYDPRVKTTTITICLALAAFTACSHADIPSVTAEVTRTKIQPSGNVWVQLLVTNAAATNQWVRGCDINIELTDGSQLSGRIEVPSLGLVPENGSEPMQGPLTDHGGPIKVDANRVSDFSVGMCVSSSDKASMLVSPSTSG